MRPYLRYIIVAFWCVITLKSNATHIMGGELYYEYLSEDSFRFSMVYYVDCENGSPAAISSDLNAIFGFFNAKTGKFIEKVEITRQPPIRVTKLNYACVTELPNACVDRYDYTFTKKINPGDDGLIIAFQRCCRNHTITNLINPGGTGMTIFARIPPKNEIAINSNPAFNDNPPNFLCNNAPLVFDHSASDADGDSLVYDLFIPYKGATSSVPRPSQPSNPPFKQVVYTSAYNLSDLMGGLEELEIDRETGLLTVWPDKIGQYVVGIRVCEYRDGVKIGETLRDYQFNVLNCVFGVQANFDIPDLDCSDTLVTFTNKSKNANSYRWDFDVDQGLVGTSTGISPSATFSKKGVYRIKLVAINLDCSDSIIKSVEIGRQDSIQASFTIFPDTACAGDTFTILNTSDQTPDWFWDLDQGMGEEHNTLVTTFVVPEPGQYDIRLRILDSANCIAEKTVIHSITTLENLTVKAGFDVEFPDLCDPGTVILTKNDNLKEGWKWNIDNQVSKFKNQVRVELKSQKPGKFSVSLLPDASSERCTTSEGDVQEIEVIGLKDIQSTAELFNVFTPNGDGLNDCYSVENIGDCFDLSLVIYSRWGELLFDSKKSGSSCWNGKRETGELYPAGTYFGIIGITNSDLDYSETMSVTVTLIR